MEVNFQKQSQEAKTHEALLFYKINHMVRISPGRR